MNLCIKNIPICNNTYLYSSYCGSFNRYLQYSYKCTRISTKLQYLVILFCKKLYHNKCILYIVSYIRDLSLFYEKK